MKNKLQYILLIVLCSVSAHEITAQESAITGKTFKQRQTAQYTKSFSSVSKAKACSVSSKDNQEIPSGTEKVIQVKQDLNFRPTVNINVYETKTTVLPARNNAVEVIVKYIAEANDEIDLQKLHNAIKENLLSSKGKEVDISTRFYKRFESNVNISASSIITMVLNNNTKISLTKFKIVDFKIYVPADLDLSIEAKYCPVDLQFSVHGTLDIKAYETQFSGRSVSGNLNIDGKYSKFEMQSAANAVLKFYESSIKTTSLTDVQIDSKYSQIMIESANRLTMKGYEDKVKIGTIPDIDLNGKYSNFKIESNKTLSAEIYEGSIESNTTDWILLKAKYLKARFNKVRKLALNDGYENEITLNEADSVISINGKFNKINSTKTNYYVNVSGYEDELKLGSVSENFDRIWISGKYTKLSLTIPSGINYKLYGVVQYPDFNINKSDYNIVYHDNENSKLTFEYYKKDKSAKQEIKLEGYEIKLNLDTE